MVVSQAPVGVEKPLDVAVQTVGGDASSHAPGTLMVDQSSSGDALEVLAVLATSYHSPPDRDLERLAIDAMRETISAGSGQHLSDVMRSGFRNANRSIFETSPQMTGEGIALLALAARGKYATIAMVGQDRGYLARAGRLNQITRDQRVVVARSRRKQEVLASSEPGSVRLLGEAERLDAKSPAIFEISLLPEDRLALLSSDLVDLIGEEAIFPGLQSDLPALIATAGSGGEHAVMAAVLSVAPAREAVPVYQSPAGQTRPIWMIVISVVLLLILFALVAFFML